MSATTKRLFKQLKIGFIQGRDFPMSGLFKKTMECLILCHYETDKPWKTDSKHGEMDSKSKKCDFDD